MRNTHRVDRRQVIRAIGGTAVAVSLAGCAGDDGSGGGDDTGGDEEPAPSDDGPVTVEVGAGNGLAFAPDAVEIPVGTTVIWEWTGEGGGHNVVATDGEFASHEDSEVESEAGYTFEHTFEEPGSYDYECIPHVGNGMVGTVTVVE